MHGEDLPKPMPSLAPIALYTIGPFAVGPVGESDPFPELHATDKTSSGQTAAVRKRCFIPLCIGPVQEFRRSHDDESRPALDALLPSVDAA